MRRKTDKLSVVCTAICILCLAAVAAWSGTVLDTNRAADQAANTAAQIQRERARNILRSCEDSNARHDATIAKIRALVDAMPAGARKDRAVQSMAGTVAIIEALAPAHKDKHGISTCPELARRQVNTK